MRQVADGFPGQATPDMLSDGKIAGAVQSRGASRAEVSPSPASTTQPASGEKPPAPTHSHDVQTCADTRSLTAKLTEVMAAVGRIAKRGRNDFHGYDYATEADIVEAVRKELIARHILIYPEVTGYEIRELAPAHDKKAARLLTIVRLRFRIQDGESGEAIEREWIGAGEDSGDKGVYKAMTGGDKYFLLKLLLIPTGDDPERDTRKPTATPKSPSVNVTTGEILDDPLPVATDEPASLTVTGVELERKGESDRGPWSLFCVTLSNGSEYATFDPNLADDASAYASEQRPVKIKSEKIKGKKRPLLKALTPLHLPSEEKVL